MRNTLLFSLLMVLGFGCGEAPISTPDQASPATPGASGKADTAYLNPDGIEMEADLEADIEAPPDLLKSGPAELGQYAMTYLRVHNQIYLESLAEVASTGQLTEWYVDGQWWSADMVARLDPIKLKRFRLLGVNVMLTGEAAAKAAEGQVFEAEVPLNPYTVMSSAADRCADKSEHLTLSDSTYWYVWNPDKEGCDAATQTMTVTLRRKLPAAKEVYPEYDQLVADKKLTVVVMFGQLYDGEFDINDLGMISFGKMIVQLKDSGFTEVKSAPVGYRFTKTIAGIEVVIDLYSPEEFSGLGDTAHFDNFQQAISEHEIVVYDGHSMLGASDFWSRPTYPDFYQIFLYGGCLGYQYYIRPIVEGKKGWDKLDLISSVTEVATNANQFAAPLLTRIFWALENGYRASWSDLMSIVRESVGNSTFGVSGVRDNRFTPAP